MIVKLLQHLSSKVNTGALIATAMLSWASLASPLCGQQSSLSAYLQTSKEYYKENSLKPISHQPTIHFVLGNESADLDSIASSISYAYFLNSKNGSTEHLYLPLLSLKKGNLALRKDTLYLFDSLQISTEDLLFLDDSSFLETLLDENKLRLILVDHNCLRPDQQHLSSSVEEILDHHFDEKIGYPLLTSENSIITEMGSTCTLVTEKFLNEKSIVLTPELATLLLGAITIDTANLRAAEKTKERDRIAQRKLLSIVPEIDPQALFDILISARNDVTGLTPSQLFDKDYKSYAEREIIYGISTVPKSASWWIEDETGLLPILDSFSKDKGIAIHIIKMVNPDPNGPKNRFIAFSSSQTLLDAFEANFKSNQLLIGVGPMPQQDSRIRYYTAKDSISRKKLQPLIHFNR